MGLTRRRKIRKILESELVAKASGIEVRIPIFFASDGISTTRACKLDYCEPSLFHITGISPRTSPRFQVVSNPLLYHHPD